MPEVSRSSADLIDEYLSDMQRCGRLRSHSVESYARTLRLHAEDVGEAGLAGATRLHVKQTLGRWGVRSQRQRHSALAGFYRWMMEEGYRPDSPAEQVRRTRATQPAVYRLTRGEVQLLMDACEPKRERRLIYLGLCTGARRAELVGLRGRHFQRQGWVHIAADAGAKGMKERWIPALPELEPICTEIRHQHGLDDPVLYSESQMCWAAPRPLDYTTVSRIVHAVAIRAGIAGNVTPHTMRHAFGTHVARHAGLRAAQLLMGHASIETTAKIYVEAPTLDEIQDSVRGFSYRGERMVRPNLVLLHGNAAQRSS